MTEKQSDPRKERLAAQLRANLRRRKAQAREVASEGESAPISEGDSPSPDQR
jgi:hypothetical protein